MIKINIIGSDSFIATKFINQSKDYLLKLFTIQLSNKNGEILKNDLSEITIEELSDCNIVINFAAIVHQPKIKDENIYKRINTDLPISLAKKAKKAGVKHFVQMSSIAVYGKAMHIHINSKEQPETIYGKSKFNADNTLLKLQDNDFKVSIIRPPMVYGGGKAPGNMMKLIKFAQKGVPMPFKNIINKRDFIHVNNLVQTLNVVIENQIHGIILPTDKYPVSTYEIVKLIQKYSSKKVRIIEIPKFLLKTIKKIKPEIYNKIYGDLTVDCNLPENLYKPKYNIETGIKEMLEAI